MNIKELIQQIEKRPQMFIADYGIEALSFFISGFLFSNIIAHRDDYIDVAFKRQFHNWTRSMIEQRTGIEFDEEQDYVYYITKIYPDEGQRLNVFFELCKEFFDKIEHA